MLTVLHGADFHLDSPFAGLRPEQAAARRRESRDGCRRLAAEARARKADLVLLAGYLFDSGSAFRETGEALREALGQIPAPVFVAPGNHDWYGPGSPYAELDWPENVHIFRGGLEAVELPALNAVVYGAAFTGPEQTQSLLRGFSAPEDGRLHLMVLHGEAGVTEGRYNPLPKEEIAASGLHYLALGHIHKPGQLQMGRTLCAWPGCLEGRGFDETGERGFYQAELDGSGARLTFVPFARRRYEIREVDVTGREPLTAVLAALPEETVEDLYRIVLTGETDDKGVDLAALREALTGRFYALELRDHSRIARDLWERAGEDSLRGLFLRELRQAMEQAKTPEEQERINQAARFGLAALDHRDMNGWEGSV